MNNNLIMPNVITCVYCGYAYPSNTPSHGESVNVLTEHIKVCEKHPMRAAELKIAILRSALIGLIGAENEDELLVMKEVMKFIPSQNKGEATAAINAIDALLETAS